MCATRVTLSPMFACNHKSTKFWRHFKHLPGNCRIYGPSMQSQCNSWHRKPFTAAPLNVVSKKPILKCNTVNRNAWTRHCSKPEEQWSLHCLLSRDTVRMRAVFKIQYVNITECSLSQLPFCACCSGQIQLRALQTVCQFSWKWLACECVPCGTLFSSGVIWRSR